MSTQPKIRDDILSYREMCDAKEIQTLQRGMNFRMRPHYSVILMSQRTNAPYHDRVHGEFVNYAAIAERSPQQDIELMPKDQDFSLQLPSRPKPVAQHADE
jgi:hypothetical protein